jgi:hypothetical protein
MDEMRTRIQCPPILRKYGTEDDKLSL